LAVRPIRRIVVIDWSPIGDLIMLSPCIRAIHSYYPEAHLALLGRPSSIAPYSSHPAVNELILYNRASGDLDLHAFSQTLAQLKRGKYDLAFVFHNSFGSAMMAWLAGIRQRVGYRRELRDLLLTRRFRVPDRRQHMLETKADLLRLSGVPVSNVHTEVFIDEQKAARWLRDKLGPNFGRNRPVIAVGLGASAVYKQWSSEGLNTYLSQFPVNSCDFVFIGSHDDRRLFEGVYSYNNTVVDLVGQTTIEELAWVMDRVDLYVGPDGGPVQLAIGRNKPVVALHSATDPALCGPYGYEPSVAIRSPRICHACDARFGKHVRQCLHTIDPQDAYIASIGLLARYCKRWTLDTA
jgi:lipopolysaccharide heptosyltransferase II